MAGNPSSTTTSNTNTTYSGRRGAARAAGGASSSAAAEAEGAGGAGAEPLLLVPVRQGTPATSAAILGCLNTADASTLRQVHPVVAGVVAGVPWADMDTPVADAVRWRAALPAAVGARVARLPDWDPGIPMAPVGAALAGVVDLDLREDLSGGVEDLLPCLPRSLRVLRLAECQDSWSSFRLKHLTSLEVLDCSDTPLKIRRLPPSLRELRMNDCTVRSTATFRHLTALRVLRIARTYYSSESRLDGSSTIASLPPSLQELDLCMLYLSPAGVSLAHLVQLRVFRAVGTDIHDATLASLPPCLLELDVAGCNALTRAASFAHLPALQALTVTRSAIGDASLASLPPGLAYLEASGCRGLTPAAVLPHLPALRVLGVSHTGIGDALIASLPAGLTDLRMLDCSSVTAGATLDHVRALQVLHIHGTGLAAAVVAACRARGCTVSAVHVLRGQRGGVVDVLASLPDGRVASRSYDSKVLLWDPARGDEAPVVFDPRTIPMALVALPDGHRLAVGSIHFGGLAEGYVEVWDVACVPPVRRATVECSSGVSKLALLPDGCLAAGCSKTIVRVDVDAGAVTAVLKGHDSDLQALAVLPDGTLVSCACGDEDVWVWDVDAQACVAWLAGHTAVVRCLAVLPDGRLASGSGDCTVRLWDVGARACVGVLAGQGNVSALAALPDGRLVAAARSPVGHDAVDSILSLWDTRPGAAAGSSRPAGAVPGTVFARLSGDVRALLPRPDGSLGFLHPRGIAVEVLAVPPPPGAAEPPTS